MFRRALPWALAFTVVVPATGATRCPDHEEQDAGSGEERRDLHRFGPDHESRFDALVDRVQLRRVLRGVIDTARHLGDLTEHRLVEPAVDLESLDVERRAGERSDPDRVDPHAAVGGSLGRLQRIGRLIVLSVGQQHDRGRRVCPAGYGCSTTPSRLWRPDKPSTSGSTPRRETVQSSAPDQMTGGSAGQFRPGSRTDWAPNERYERRKPLTSQA